MKAEPFEICYVKTESGCWEWARYRNFAGYGRYRQQGAHRVSFEMANGPIPPGMVICHKCDNPPCVNPDHLFVGTMADNNRDRVEKGRSAHWNGKRRGRNNPRAKLSPEDVAEIRSLRGKVLQNELAERFGCHPTNISQIQTGRVWLGVPGADEEADVVANLREWASAKDTVPSVVRRGISQGADIIDALRAENQSLSDRIAVLREAIIYAAETTNDKHTARKLFASLTVEGTNG